MQAEQPLSFAGNCAKAFVGGPSFLAPGFGKREGTKETEGFLQG